MYKNSINLVTPAVINLVAPTTTTNKYILCVYTKNTHSFKVMT